MFNEVQTFDEDTFILVKKVFLVRLVLIRASEMIGDADFIRLKVIS
jgi:hypothetical protein